MSAEFRLKAAMITTVIVGTLMVGGYLVKSELIEGMGIVHAAPAPAPQAVPVTVMVVQSKPIRLWTEFSGRLSAIDWVELRPQVSGTIKEIRFEDGQMTAKGDVLVVIDPRPYRAAVAEAKAELNMARHTLDLAKKQRARAKPLVAKGHVSQSVMDERIKDHTVAISQVNSAKAKLEQTEIALDYAYVKAPISGRLSRAEITEGNLVEAGPNAPVLTSIVATEGIYADFDVDERTYLRHMHAVAKAGGAVSTLPVELTINAAELRTYRGHIQSFDNQIDSATGTIRARAIFSNEDGSLLPGIFAEVRLGSPEVEEVVLLGAGAVGTDQDRKFVYVVDEADKVVYREVSLGASVGGERVITRGLETGERVVIGGLIKVRPGMSVAPRLLGAETPAVSSDSQSSIEIAATK